MTRSYATRGMTLLEVGLAISLGLMILGAAGYAYVSARDSAGDATAATKVGDLQAVVEASYSQRGYYPSGDEVRNAMAARRDDLLRSPWGGNITVNDTAAVVNGIWDYDSDPVTIANGTDYSSQTSEPVFSAGPPQKLRGADFLYYTRLAAPGDQTVEITVPDLATGTTKTCRQYFVGIDKHFQRWYFVRTGS